MTARAGDEPSFSVKYRCPVFHTRQFDSSPSTQTSKNSASSRSRTRTVSSVTESTRRGWGTGGPGAAGATGGSSSSSSNGRSNRSLIGDVCHLPQIVRAHAEALDARGASGLLVGIDEHAVQPRVGGCRIEFLWQRGQEAAERGADLDADHR